MKNIYNLRIHVVNTNPYGFPGETYTDGINQKYILQRTYDVFYKKDIRQKTSPLNHNDSLAAINFNNPIS